MARGRQAGGCEEALLTFPQGVQAVEHEMVDGAADDAVVQRGRAAPSGQHRRELSKGRADRPQWVPARVRGEAAGEPILQPTSFPPRPERGRL